MKVALLGPEGTYTHQAADRYFENLEPEFCSTIKEVFESDVETKFVPVENSLGGRVTDTIDLLHEHDERVTAEVRLPIRHALISNEDSVGDIETVKSHPQAISQSKEIIEENGWSTEETNSTAAAVEDLGEGEAALASEIAAELNDVPVVRKAVQDADNNTTRFFVLNGEKEDGEKTAMIVDPSDDRPGLLQSILTCFSGHQINLSHIQSRPTREKLGEYYFYVEAEEGRGEKLEDAKQCLETYAEVHDFGSFSVVGVGDA